MKSLKEEDLKSLYSHIIELSKFKMEAETGICLYTYKNVKQSILFDNILFEVSWEGSLCNCCPSECFYCNNISFEEAIMNPPPTYDDLRNKRLEKERLIKKNKIKQEEEQKSKASLREKVLKTLTEEERLALGILK